MYDAVCVPTDGSDAADAALDLAISVADAHEATLHVLNVADTNQPSLARIEGEVQDVLEGAGKEIVDEAATKARSAGVDVTTAVVQGGPSRTIREYVEDREVDLVVMGTRGQRTVERIILGSVTERVLRSSQVPVLVVPPDSDREYPPEQVLVGTDGSDGSAAAVTESLEICAARTSELHALSVVESTLLGFDVRSSTLAEERERRDEDLLSSVRDQAAERGIDVETTIEEGDVVETLNDYVAEHGIDLVVVGTHGRTGIDHRLLGSVTENLMRSASVPVLSVRATES